MNMYPPTPIQLDPQALSLRWLFIDMNSYFASCEQQARPELRGKPIAIVPMEAETTCAIAASYEAKAFGIKTGTLIREAKAMCPKLILVPARPRLYVTYHHRFVEAIEQCIPVEDVLSVDEVACRLDRTQQTPEAIRILAQRIKTVMHEQMGACLTCSIGAASNKLLAKLASDMQKPDGLVILEPSAMPTPILHLKPSDICGIGRNMSLRLAERGIQTMPELWALDSTHLRQIWGGVTGARFHALLHGADLPSPVRPRRSMGHQHVLSPEQRTLLLATPVIRQLLTKLALRLREESFYARRLILDIKWMGALGHFVEEARFHETQETQRLMKTLTTLWSRAPTGLKPLRIGVTLADLVPITKHQYDLFEKPANAALTQALDHINEKYGRDTIAFGNVGETIKSKISFHRVPSLAET
ncbi:MAG: DNA polymerase [Proteobacteria bacterium]|nr:DNA polymerase [Pseudomonadota bacterium]